MSANPGALPGWFDRRNKDDDQPHIPQNEGVPNEGVPNKGVPEQTKVHGTTHTTTGGGKDDQTPVVVWEAANRMEAEIVAGRLQSEGIPAIIRGEALGAIYGLTTGTLAAANVLVPALLAEKALAILTSSVEWDDTELGDMADADGYDVNGGGVDANAPDRDANHNHHG